MNDDALAYLAVEHLQRAYADIATRRAFVEAASILTPDATISFDTHSGEVFEIEGPIQFGEFGTKMTAGFSFYEFIPLNFVVTVAPDGTARGRSYSLEVAENEQNRDWIEFYGIYDDEYRTFQGEWRFSRRRYRTYARRTAGRLEAHPL
jgi:SnoaL-like domain